MKVEIINKNNVLKVFDNIPKQSEPREIGGLFIGKVNRVSEVIEIHDVLEIENIAENIPGLYKAGSVFTKPIMQKMFEFSQAGLKTVGEWHYHPSGIGFPSPQDLIAWSEKAAIAGRIFVFGITTANFKKNEREIAFFYQNELGVIDQQPFFTYNEVCKDESVLDFK